MYAAIDALVDKLDRMVLKAKEKRVADRHDSAEIKRDPAVWSPESEPPAASAGTPRV